MNLKLCANPRPCAAIPVGVYAIGAVIALLVSTAAVAEPSNARLYKAQFGYMPSCNACHQDGGGSPLNPYGDAFKAARGNAAAFAAIAPADADGDGHSNAEEATARSNPGDGSSTPEKPGSWLDMRQLIPKQVQAAFPQARLYKPIDAILTAKEQEKARAWGIELKAEDENTIYVPIVERKPVGTAVIVRGEWAEQAYFLLVTTNRQLALEQVVPVSGDALPDAASPAYTRWAGMTAAAFQATAESGSQDAAIGNTVHKALALIQARLKK